MRADLYQEWLDHQKECPHCRGGSPDCVQGRQLKSWGDHRAAEIKRGAQQRARNVLGYVSAVESRP